MVISYEDLFNLMKEKLVNHSCPEDLATRAARNMASSSRDGVLSHGVYRFERLITMIDSGFVKPANRPSLERSLGALEVWNGNLGMGNTNAEDMMTRAIELANSYGIGCIALSHTNHWMRGGAFGAQAAEKGFAAICWTNTIANMAPWGAANKAIGNNPLVMAVPYKDSYVLFDGAMSQFSYGALEKAIIAGKKLPVPGGYDKDGNLTDDPKAISESGRVLPMGFWKGSSISILMDMMVNSIAGGFTVPDIAKQGNTPLAERDLSQIFIAIKVEKDIGDNAVSNIVEAIKGCTPLDGASSVRYPSENLMKIREKSLKDGIEITDDSYNRIVNL